MDKFYNESWGGENFNHQEIQKNMSRDKSLWVIDPKDRMPNPPKRRVTCNYCNRGGHRDDTCRLKPPVCHMCGHTGHYEPRCPRKICVNCGSPNFMYSTSCRNCTAWRALTCAECGQHGHPASHCPDTWRRYHNTIDENMPLEQCGEKPQYQLQCSGCTRRGHLAHTCRTFLPLSSSPSPPTASRDTSASTPLRPHTRTRPHTRIRPTLTSGSPTRPPRMRRTSIKEEIFPTAISIGRGLFLKMSKIGRGKYPRVRCGRRKILKVEIGRGITLKICSPANRKRSKMPKQRRHPILSLSELIQTATAK
ncbi:uncharacterized protein LOC125225270 isoform X2 [Leguminivora glycinivorella]|uniref:uncharacterized protein LOC125225270 isoform X2 n=1 Tax=Leguminivora glycinivorella TaxID=1035111 RepID=UPI002010394A|nr:uncharacterized protein LOC125225270 isoform X2 [Leguminivora glycinivorella]